MKSQTNKKQQENQNEDLEGDVKYALLKSADTFLNGFLFSMVRDTISNIMNIGNPENSNIQFDPKFFLLNSICTGVEFASFDLTDGLFDAAIQPNLNTFAKWIPWTITTATCSSIVSRAIQNYLQSAARHEKFSFENYKDELKISIPQSIGFNVSRLYADMVLPPKQKIGGKYMRSTLCLLAGNIGCAATTVPILIQQYPLKSIALGFLPILPLCFVENALFSSVKSLVKPLRLVS